MTNQNTVCRDGEQLIAHDSERGYGGRDRLGGDGDEDTDEGQ